MCTDFQNDNCIDFEGIHSEPILAIFRLPSSLVEKSNL